MAGPQTLFEQSRVLPRDDRPARTLERLAQREGQERPQRHVPSLSVPEEPNRSCPRVQVLFVLVFEHVLLIVKAILDVRAARHLRADDSTQRATACVRLYVHKRFHNIIMARGRIRIQCVTMITGKQYAAPKACCCGNTMCYAAHVLPRAGRSSSPMRPLPPKSTALSWTAS